MNVKAFHAAMCEVRDGERRDEIGICTNVMDLLCIDGTTRGWYHWIEANAQLWPEYSGHKEYPVPHSDYDPESAYNESDDLLWDMDTEYGQARMRLLNFLIERAEEEIKQ